MTRSADWWAGWQEAVAAACDASCKGCRDALPIDPEQPGRYHIVVDPRRGTSWSICLAESIIRWAERFQEAAQERERQAAAESRGWDGVAGDE